MSQTIGNLSDVQPVTQRYKQRTVGVQLRMLSQLYSATSKEQ